MEPITLDIADIIRKGREAFEAKTLAAINPPEDGPGCAYRSSSGAPCIIGAAMTDEQAERLKEAGLNSIDIGNLIASGTVKIVGVDSESDDPTLFSDADRVAKRLQAAHDKAARQIHEDEIDIEAGAMLIDSALWEAEAWLAKQATSNGRNT